ncbi:hypothetical protein [Pseudomonas sp. TE3610]
MLFLALAVRFVDSSPKIEEAAALAAGQVTHRVGLQTLTVQECTTLPVALLHAHPRVAEPREFLRTAQSMLLRSCPLFELDGDELLVELTDQYRYHLVNAVSVEEVIEEYLRVVCAYTPPVRKKLPEKSGFILKAKIASSAPDKDRYGNHTALRRFHQAFTIYNLYAFTFYKLENTLCAFTIDVTTSINDRAKACLPLLLHELHLLGQSEGLEANGRQIRPFELENLGVMKCSRIPS